MRTTTFRNRQEAGRRLAERLAGIDDDVVVVTLPRGGVPVGAEVARALGCPLDVLIVRKLGVPSQPELGFGALAEDGIRVLNRDLVARAGLTERQIDRVAEREQAEVERRVRTYRRGRPMQPVRGRTVILVDDGVATGFTARAAIEALRVLEPKQVILAVPVAAPDTLDELAQLADEAIALEAPRYLMAIGQWYDDFRQVSDDEVADILAELDRRESTTGSAAAEPVSREVAIDLDGVRPADHLPGILTVPPDPSGLVLFAHGSGSSRLSPRNTAVARALQQTGSATLLFDLLTPTEADSRANVFDVDLLADRLELATTRILADPQVAGLPVGYFGASTGAAAALAAAARPTSTVAAVVSRGGRPDLAGSALSNVRAPTLLIVGGRDDTVLELNRAAQRQLRCPNRLEIVAGATHLFEEPGTLEQVMTLAGDWFAHHFGASRRP